MHSSLEPSEICKSKEENPDKANLLHNRGQSRCVYQLTLDSRVFSSYLAFAIFVSFEQATEQPYA
jgi:hypothetical protein